MQSSTQQCQSFVPSMPALYRAYGDQSSFTPASITMAPRHDNPRARPNANGRPPFPDLGLPRREWRAITDASPARTPREEVSIVAPRRGSLPRLHGFIARMEESLSSDVSWVDEAPTPPSSPKTIILGSPNASSLVDNANGFATSAPKRRKIEIEIEREDVSPHVPGSSRPELTLYDSLVQMRQARAQHVDRANRFVSCGANPQEIQPATAGARPHVPRNDRHPSSPPPPAQASDLTRANVVPWFAAQGVELRPEEAQVLDAFLARRYEGPPSPAPAFTPPSTPPYLTRANLVPWFSAQGVELSPEEAQVLDDFLARRYESPPSPAPAFPPPRALGTPPSTPERRQITIASMLAERENPLLEPLRSRLFLLEQAGLGDMDFDGGVATELMAVWPYWED